MMFKAIKSGQYVLMLVLAISVALSMVSAAAPTRAQDSPDQAEPFAAFDPGTVETSGRVPAYAVAPDFGNVVLSEALTTTQRDYLVRNAFVVSPSAEKEFYTIYEKARYAYQPLFITTDSLLHSFHLVFSKVLRTAETDAFHPLLKNLTQRTLAAAEQLHDELAGTDWEQAAQQTVAYLVVAAALADPEWTGAPQYAVPLASPDIASANQAAGISPSAVFPNLDFGEDWSQYKPRGHYTRTEALSNYFRAMMWYGRMTFRLSEAEETKAALLLTLAIRNANALQQWNDLYAPTVFFVGKSDDLTIPQYLQVLEQVYGASADAAALRSLGVEPFVAAAQALPSPRILNTVIQDTDDIDEKTKGLRFMGQRFVWDAYVFRNLIYRNVGTREDPRPLPMALDVFAALGSARALEILEQEGATAYENYLSQLEKVRGEVAGVTEAEWTETLYNAWLYTFNTLAQPVPEGYPSFMTNAAYLDRSLYAALGSYAELKHDTILYAEQAYAEMGGGGGKSPPPEPVPPPNYVEPVPLFWARLAALAEMSIEGLSKRDLLDPTDDDTLRTIALLARNFQRYSEKQLRNEPLADEEQRELRFYGGALEMIYKNSVESTEPGAPASFFMDHEPRAAIVTDIATNPDPGEVLQIGTGNVFNIYVVVPVEGKLWLARGGVFSFYEFTQPLSERLTNEEWWAMLDGGQTPPLPAWTASFITQETVEGELASAVHVFQSWIVYALWYEPDREYERLRTREDGVSKYTLSQLAPLTQAGQYEGRQIIETNYRSFDMQDANTAIVATRETWRGQLHSANPDDPYSDGPQVAERGPYVIDVTYTLTRGEYGWEVVNVVVHTPLPEWTPVN